MRSNAHPRSRLFIKLSSEYTCQLAEERTAEVAVTMSVPNKHGALPQVRGFKVVNKPTDLDALLA